MKQTSIKKKKVLHVVPTATGSWAIKAAGSPAPIKTFATKAQATTYAKKLVSVRTASSKKRGAVTAPATVNAKASIVTHGEWIFFSQVSSHGKTLKIAPAASEPGAPTFGSAAGKFVVESDFDAIPEDFAAYVE